MTRATACRARSSDDTRTVVARLDSHRLTAADDDRIVPPAVAVDGYPSVSLNSLCVYAGSTTIRPEVPRCRHQTIRRIDQASGCRLVTIAHRGRLRFSGEPRGCISR